MTYWYLAVKHWRTLLFGLLALGFLLASGYALLLRKDFVVVQTQHKAEVGRYELREVELLAVIEGYKAQESRFASLVKAEADKLEAARDESAEATKAAETAKANAARSESGWMRQYAKRPESCKVALDALEVACGSYASY